MGADCMLKIINSLLIIFTTVTTISVSSQEMLQDDAERLLFIEPDGWQQIFTDRVDNLSTTEYAPNGSTEKDWKELLSVQQLVNIPDADLDEMVTRVVDHLSRSCADFDIKPIALSGVSHQYPTLGLMVFCGASTQNGLGEFSIIRAISGKENFYILRKSWRTEPFSTDDGAPVDMESRKFWLGYLSYLSVCQPGLGNCPPS